MPFLLKKLAILPKLVIFGVTSSSNGLTWLTHQHFMATFPEIQWVNGLMKIEVFLGTPLVYTCCRMAVCGKDMQKRPKLGARERSSHTLLCTSLTITTTSARLLKIFHVLAKLEAVWKEVTLQNPLLSMSGLPENSSFSSLDCCVEIIQLCVSGGAPTHYEEPAQAGL